MIASKIFKKLCVYLLIIFCFLFDLFCAIFFKKYYVQSLLCILIAQSARKTSLFTISTILLLLSFESFLFYGLFGFDLGFLLLLVFIILKAKKVFVSTFWLSLSSLFAYLIVQKVITETVLLGLNFSFKYTFFSIFVNILIMYLILKFLNKVCHGSSNYVGQGRQDNRFYV